MRAETFTKTFKGMWSTAPVIKKMTPYFPLTELLSRLALQRRSEKGSAKGGPALGVEIRRGRLAFLQLCPTTESAQALKRRVQNGSVHSFGFFSEAPPLPFYCA